MRKSSMHFSKVLLCPRAFFRPLLTLLTVCVLALLCVNPCLAQKQKIDEEYTKKILEFTTDTHFLTKYVNYLPYSKDVPTPLDVLGRIAGAADALRFRGCGHEVFPELPPVLGG